MKRIVSYLLVAFSFALLAGCSTLRIGGTSTFNGTSGVILFQNASSSLNAAGSASVNKIAAYLRKTKGKILVDGHTDTNGSAKYNEALSKRRASTVKAALVSRGVKSNRITTKGFGLTRPAVPYAETPAEHAKNRRVEVSFYNACKKCR